MRLEWIHEIDLPDDRPDSSQAPLCWHDGHVWLPVTEFTRPRGTASALNPRGLRFHVHRIDASGHAEASTFEIKRAPISQAWSFLQLGSTLVLHAASFHALPYGAQLAELPHCDASSGPGRGHFVFLGRRLFFANTRGGDVYCHDVDTFERIWTLSLPNHHRQPVGPVASRGEQLVCYGNDVLNYIDTRVPY